MNFIAIDFETANNDRSSICSVGIAVVEKWEIVETRHILVKPTPNYYDRRNVAIHGIQDKHTKDKKTFREQWKELKPYFHNKVIVAHNAAFDCSALRYALNTAKLAYPDVEYHCTYRLAQRALDLPGYKLNEVSDRLNISLQHHNAESDAKACALIAIRLMEKNKAYSLNELSIKLGFSIGKIIAKTKSYTPFSNK